MDTQKLESLKQLIKPFSKKPSSRSDADITAITKIISDFNIFNTINKAKNPQCFLNEISKVLSIEIYDPGDPILNYGDLESNFYIILYGKLSVQIPDIPKSKGSSPDLYGSISVRNFLQDPESSHTPKEIPNNSILKKHLISILQYKKQNSLKQEITYNPYLRLHEENKEISQLKQGDTIGNLTLTAETPRTSSILAKDLSILAMLTKEDYNKILAQEEEKLIKEKVNFLYKLPIFNGYTRQNVKKLSWLFQEVKYKKGQYVYRENYPADCLFFIYEGEFKLFQTRGHSVRKIIDYPGGFLSDQRPYITVNKARDIKEAFQLQLTIKGKNEIFGYEEYVKKLPTRTQSCVCISTQAVVYSINSEDFRMKITENESLKFLKARCDRDLERHDSLKKAQVVVEGILSNSFRNSASRSSSAFKSGSITPKPPTVKSKRIFSYSGIEDNKKKVSTVLKPKKPSIKLMNLKLNSLKTKTSRDNCSHERVSVPNTQRVNTTFLLKKNIDLPIKNCLGRIKRLPPPNFMKISRENFRRTNFDKRSPLSARVTKGLSCERSNKYFV